MRSPSLRRPTGLTVMTEALSSVERLRLAQGSGWAAVGSSLTHARLYRPRARPGPDSLRLHESTYGMVA